MWTAIFKEAQERGDPPMAFITRHKARRGVWLICTANDDREVLMNETTIRRYYRLENE